MNCAICFSAYDLKENIPSILSCGHTYCKLCLETYSKKFSNYLNCPFCKEKSLLTVLNGKSVFKKNFALISILEINPKKTKSLIESEKNKKQLKIICNIFDIVCQKQINGEKKNKNFTREKILNYNIEHRDNQGNMNNVHCEFEIPSNEFKITELEINVETKDQGWATSNGSGSWITARILDSQKNKISEIKIWENYRVKDYVWRNKKFGYKNNDKTFDDFFSGFLKGKKLQIISHSIWSGWRCHTRGVKIVFRGIKKLQLGLRRRSNSI